LYILAFEESIDGCACERLHILTLMAARHEHILALMPYISQKKNNDPSRNFFPLLLALMTYMDISQ